MEEKRKPGRPVGTKRHDPETAKEQRATFIVRKDILQKIKLLAQAESRRVSIQGDQEAAVKLKVVVNDALDQYVTKYEKKHGSL